MSKLDKLIIEPELEICLPPLREDKYQLLKASIAKGYDPAKPIVLWKERPNTIVDGHHRYRACRELGTEPTTIEESFESIDAAILYTLRRQTEQRDLTTGQKITIAEQMMSIEGRMQLEKKAREAEYQARPRDGTGKFIRPPTAPQEGVNEIAQKIADKAGTNVSSVYRYHAVQKRAIPEILKLVESGEVGLDSADRFVRKIPSESEQREIYETGGRDAVLSRSSKMRKEQEAQSRAQKEVEERRKFQQLESDVAKEVKKATGRIEKMFGGSERVCLLPNVNELWCNTCSWGFDTYLPPPTNNISCPYCGGSDPIKRDAAWHPDIEVKS